MRIQRDLDLMQNATSPGSLMARLRPYGKIGSPSERETEIA